MEEKSFIVSPDLITRHGHTSARRRRNLFKASGDMMILGLTRIRRRLSEGCTYLTPDPLLFLYSSELKLCVRQDRMKLDRRIGTRKQITKL